jgi:hypothetical protein
MMTVRSIRLRPVRGSIDLGELAQGLDDLAGPLAAGGDDHDVDVGVAAGDLLEHRLPRPKGPGMQ